MIVYSGVLIKDLRIRETSRVELLVKSMQYLQKNSESVSAETVDLILPILEENNQLPLIITDANKKPLLEEGTYKNIPTDVLNNKDELREYIAEMERHYKPFEMNFADTKQYVFYDNSRLLNNLQYYPLFLGVFILAYLFCSIWLMRTVKKQDEGFLWAGLAKETAHQIGTPLSSMIGWIEIMKMENPEPMGVSEIEKDIVRLKTISERFSKIGSVPELNDYNLNETLQQNYDYLKTRISTKVDFKLQIPDEEILLPHNRILFSWVIENLVKNAVDAMKGVGTLEVCMYEKNKNLVIDFKDSGIGMTSKQARKVFKPGFSTKKRGWGLGLSLAHRVIHDYHKGSIYVAQTEPNKGSTFRIKLKTTS